MIAVHAADGAADGTDDGPGDTRRAAKDVRRRCLATGVSRPTSEMVRFVVGPDDVIVPDVAESLPGRGFWLSADPISIKTACARNLFSRAARKAVRANDALAEQVEDLLARRCVELLALARRAGQAVSGFEKVRGWLRGGRAACLLAAIDGAADGRAKLGRIAGDLPVIAVLRAGELGTAFAREETVHAALAPGGLAMRFAETASRLAGFRPPAETGADDRNGSGPVSGPVRGGRSRPKSGTNPEMRGRR